MGPSLELNLSAGLRVLTISLKSLLLGFFIEELAVDQLIELLDDPSYDVKVMATRGLAQTRSRVAEDKLLRLLEDPELSALHDQAAWALGELRSLRAVDRPGTRSRALTAPAGNRLVASPVAWVQHIRDCVVFTHL